MKNALNFKLSGVAKSLALGALTAAAFTAPAHAAWEPKKPVEFIVPAGTGGGADQMARLIQGIIIKHKLMKEPLIVINKSGGAGAEGFLDVKNSAGDANKIVITLSNVFTTPLATGVPFSWRDMTPVSMLALDQFVLWTNSEAPYKTAADFAAAAKAAPGAMKIGGTGSKQEDQIISFGLQKALDTTFIYVPFKGGGDVAVQLVGRHIDASVNNPAEAVSQWRGGRLNALCLFDEERMPYKEKVTETMSWNDIPTCKEAGISTNYVMLRGIFMPPKVRIDQRQYYIDLFNKVAETQEWKDYMMRGAFNTTTMSGDQFMQWLIKAEDQHRSLMKEAGFLAK